MSTHTIVFPKTVLAESVDALALDGVQPVVDDTVIFDLAAAEFIEPAAVLSLVSAAHSVQSSDSGISVKFNLPKRRKTRDFLRRWRFGSTLASVLGHGSAGEDLLTASSAAYQKEVGEGLQNYSPSTRTDGRGQLQDMASRRFFTTRTTPLPSNMEDAIALARSERERWRRPEIHAILQHSLGRKAYLIAPAVVYESVMNTAMHPGASRFVILSHLNTNSTKKYPAGLLTISVWDNGRSIGSTLSNAVAEGRALRTGDYDQYYEWYALYNKDEKAGKWAHDKDVYSGEAPEDGFNDRDALITSTFPGVSSLHSRAKTDADDELLGHDWDKTGMGLWIFVSTVIDSFGGEVAIRSGDRFSNIKRASGADQLDRRAHFRCNSLQQRTSVPYRGNQITARIPLIGSANDES